MTTTPNTAAASAAGNIVDLEIACFTASGRLSEAARALDEAQQRLAKARAGQPAGPRRMKAEAFCRLAAPGRIAAIAAYMGTDGPEAIRSLSLHSEGGRLDRGGYDGKSHARGVLVKLLRLTATGMTQPSFPDIAAAMGTRGHSTYVEADHRPVRVKSIPRRYSRLVALARLLGVLDAPAHEEIEWEPVDVPVEGVRRGTPRAKPRPAGARLPSSRRAGARA